MGGHEKGGDANEDLDLLQANLVLSKHMLAYMDSFVLKSAVELRIPDILHAHAQPMSLPQIASKIQSPSLDITSLARVMRLLVRNKIFTIDSSDSEEEPMYGLTSASKLLVHDHKYSCAPILKTFTHPSIMAAWQEIGPSIKEGVTPFVKAHGESFWEMTSNNDEFSKMFNTGMASCTKPMLDGIMSGYKDGFSKLEGRLVDIGGGIGKLISKIVEEHPHIEGLNFDLPHTVENAPNFPGVTHVGGDMFKEIPSANNVIIKSVLLDWENEACIKILKNCQKAVLEKKGKVIIVDIILYPHRYMMSDDLAIALDLMMMTHYGGGIRTEIEWKYLLNHAGFTHFNIIPIQSTVLSIIEASTQ